MSLVGHWVGKILKCDTKEVKNSSKSIMLNLSNTRWMYLSWFNHSLLFKKYLWIFTSKMLLSLSKSFILNANFSWCWHPLTLDWFFIKMIMSFSWNIKIIRFKISLFIFFIYTQESFTFCENTFICLDPYNDLSNLQTLLIGSHIFSSQEIHK